MPYLTFCDQLLSSICGKVALRKGFSCKERYLESKFFPEPPWGGGLQRPQTPWCPPAGIIGRYAASKIFRGKTNFLISTLSLGSIFFIQMKMVRNWDFPVLRRFARLDLRCAIWPRLQNSLLRGLPIFVLQNIHIVIFKNGGLIIPLSSNTANNLCAAKYSHRHLQKRRIDYTINKF